MNFGAIFKRLLSGAAAVGAIAACAACAVVAAAFAIFMLLNEFVGGPGAAAIVALVFALLAGVGTLIGTRGTGGAKAKAKRKAEPPAPPESLVDRAIDLAREKPLIAAGMAVAAGLMALRNPIIVSTFLSSLMRPRKPKT